MFFSSFIVVLFQIKQFLFWTFEIANLKSINMIVFFSSKIDIEIEIYVLKNK